MRVSYGFLAACGVFGLKVLIRPDAASVILSVMFLLAYMSLYFFGLGTAHAEVSRKVGEIEATTKSEVARIAAELEEIKRLQTQINLASGIRPGFGGR